jgi:transcriptional regulator with XRE-family HTH domain
MGSTALSRRISALTYGLKDEVAAGPHRIDIRLGKRLRDLRTQRKMTQLNLADAIGVSYQSIQKYERGDNRISASTLYDIAVAIGVTVAAFYDGLELDLSTETPDFENEQISAFLQSETGSALVKAIIKTSSGVQRDLITLVEALARTPPNASRPSDEGHGTLN